MDVFRRRNRPISEEQLQQKLATLPPELQAEFLRITDTLLQKESEVFLQIIQNSRQEIQQISNDIKQDSTILADPTKPEASNSKLKESTNKLEEFVMKRQKKKKTGPQVRSGGSEKEREAVDNYLKAVGRSKEQDGSGSNAAASYARPITAGKKSEGGIKMRLGTPSEFVEDFNDNEFVEMDESGTEVKQQKDELFSKMKEQDNQLESEKERQMKLIEQKKQERLQKSKAGADGGLAANLMDQSRETNEKQRQQKLQQEKAIQDRIEKMRHKTGQPTNLDERTATMIDETKNSNSPSIFEEGRQENELKIRPNTGERKSSPRRSPRRTEKKEETEEFEMSPSKGWYDGNEEEKNKNKKKDHETIRIDENDLECVDLDV